jgi:hypothetical protein
MNLIVDDTDHPLIIKVASIPQIRLQVYFIDNEEFFHRKAIGWALRDYGKTNPRWVRGWVDTHPELSGLSQREALRLLGSRKGA